MSVELIGATLTWAVIGYLLDRWLGTGPWLLVVGALLGNAAGIYLLWYRSERMEGGSRYVSSTESSTGSGAEAHGQHEPESVR